MGSRALPTPEVHGERAERRLPCAPARTVGLCQRKEEMGLEQPELQEMNRSSLRLVGEAGTGLGRGPQSPGPASWCGN